MIQVPKDPPEALLVSMAYRYRHDFGLESDGFTGVTPGERTMILLTMRQLYEEATGQGFYKISEG